MKCENCIHKGICSSYELYEEIEYRPIVDNCSHYKAKDKVIELPCKVGDTVYKIGSIYRRGKEKFYIYQGEFGYSCIRRFGDTVFLTKEEAEKALKELKESNSPLLNKENEK